MDGILYGGDVALLVEEHPEDETEVKPESICCKRCNLPFHPSLKSRPDQETVSVPRSELNHVLTALQEAIDLTQGMAPYMGLRWDVALKEIIEAIDRPVADTSLLTPVIQEKSTP